MTNNTVGDIVMLYKIIHEKLSKGAYRKRKSAFAFFILRIQGGISHEIKRHLLLGRKVMTNLDSIFKSRDITLSTKVHLVKAMVFPVVM